MSLSNLFESYIAGGASSELREEILLLVTKYIAASQRAGPVIKLSAEVWEDPRMAPYESVPTSVLLELDNMRNRKLDKMPVSAGELVFRKKADAWRRWQVIRKYEQSVAEPEKIDERFLRIADAAFNSLENGPAIPIISDRPVVLCRQVEPGGPIPGLLRPGAHQKRLRKAADSLQGSYHRPNC